MRSDSSTSSPVSEDSDSDSKTPIILHTNKSKTVTPHREAQALRKNASHNHQLVVSDASGRMIGTNTPIKSISKTLEKPTITQATLGKSIQETSQPTTSFAEDFLANRLALPGKGRVSRTLVERFSSRYSELRNITDLACYSWKTLKDYYPRPSSIKQATLSQGRMEESLKQSSSPWKTWGIGGSTKFLIARITGSHRIGKECSLSDILEKDVADRYFLSQKQVESLMSGIQKSKPHRRPKAQDTQQETTEE